MNTPAARAPRAPAPLNGLRSKGNPSRKRSAMLGRVSVASAHKNDQDATQRAPCEHRARARVDSVVNRAHSGSESKDPHQAMEYGKTAQASPPAAPASRPKRRTPRAWAATQVREPRKACANRPALQLEPNRA